MKPCVADGCDRPARSQASWSRALYCAKHADRVRLHGSPDHDGKRSAWDRFVDLVIVEVSGCWRWIGSGAGRDKEYGQFWFNNTNGLAHRFAYETMVGPIPSDLEIDHARKGATK